MSPRLVSVDDIVGLSSDTTLGNGIIYQTPTTTVTIGGEEIGPTQIKIKTNRFAETARADVTGIWYDRVPASGEQIEIDINDYRVFTGTTESIDDNGDGSYKVVAFDAIKKLIRTRINMTFSSSNVGVIIDRIADKIGVDMDINIPDDRNFIVPCQYIDDSAIKILNQVTRWSDTYWWVDGRNTIHVGPPEPTLHEFSSDFIGENPTAGEKEPPYQKVVAIGESPSSQSTEGDSPGGYYAAHMLSKDPPRATAGDGEPVYRYKSRRIITQAQAEAVAKSILKEFKRQRAEGDVDIIGEGAPIRPLDVIRMPEQFDEDQYLVSGVTHKFSNNDGFISTVNAGGLIDV